MPIKRLSQTDLVKSAVLDDRLAKREAKKSVSIKRNPTPQTFAKTVTFVVHHPSDVNTETLLRNVRMQFNGPDDIADRSKSKIRSPLTAIRAKCLSCKGDNPVVGVRECISVTCSSWPFRMGFNPFFGKLHEASDETGDIE